MAKKLTPQEQDRQATLAAQGQQVESAAPAGGSPLRVWSLAGLLAALAFVGGFFGGQWYERALHGGDAELIGLLGARLVDSLRRHAVRPGGDWRAVLRGGYPER